MSRINLVRAQLLVDEENEEERDKQHEAELEEQRIQDMHDEWDRQWMEKQHERNFDWDDQDWGDEFPEPDQHHDMHYYGYMD